MSDVSTWPKCICPHCGQTTVHNPFFGTVSICRHCKKKFSYDQRGVNRLPDDYRYALSPDLREYIKKLIRDWKSGGSGGFPPT